MSKLKKLTGDELVYIAATIAVTVAKEIDNTDAIILSNLLGAIGGNLAIIAAKRAVPSTEADLLSHR